VREAALAALEERRREKLIGSSLEAGLEIEADSERFGLLKRYEQILPSLFIVSQVELKEAGEFPQKPDFLVRVFKAKGDKCERCWNYREAVGRDAAHPTLCDRCLEAIH
ncbi:MAG: isoleucine--tRNA ligase, partial [Nitrospira sp.]|nr:isoleucine--tRNA ligase [Nitrospira sp.]